MESAISQEFNLASGKETRIIDLAHMINDLTENTAGVQLAERRKWDTHSRLLASIDRARSVIGYEPRTPFEDGLKATIRWFQENWDRIDASASFGPGVSSAVRELSASAG